jgi:hypothetical protein
MPDRFLLPPGVSDKDILHLLYAKSVNIDEGVARVEKSQATLARRIDAVVESKAALEVRVSTSEQKLVDFGSDLQKAVDIITDNGKRLVAVETRLANAGASGKTLDYLLRYAWPVILPVLLYYLLGA